MGLFDDIRCEYPIEGVEPFEDQTKDLECYQRQYLIDTKGQLLIKTWDRIPYTDEEKAENINRSKSFGPAWNVAGKRVNERWEPADFSGGLTLDIDDSRRVTFVIIKGIVKSHEVWTA